jgi:hypothetical protein
MDKKSLKKPKKSHKSDKRTPFRQIRRLMSKCHNAINHSKKIYDNADIDHFIDYYVDVKMKSNLVLISVLMVAWLPFLQCRNLDRRTRITRNFEHNFAQKASKLPIAVEEFLTNYTNSVLESLSKLRMDVNERYGVLDDDSGNLK